MIYIAAPYSHPDEEVIEHRMKVVQRAIAKYMSLGVHALSPLLAHHVLNEGIELPTNYEFWQDYCKDILVRCDSMKIITLPGWKESIGIADEIKCCQRNHMPFSNVTEEWVMEV